MHMHWHPNTGEMKVFAKPEDVPEGWLDHHPFPGGKPETAEQAEGKDAAPVMTRDEITAALTVGGFSFKKNAPTPALYKQLHGYLVAHLAGAGVEFDESADAKTLLGLVVPEA